MEMVIFCVFFVFESWQNQTSMARVPYNKLLTNLASSSCTGMGNIGPWSFLYVSLGPYCPDLGPIFPSTALALS